MQVTYGKVTKLLRDAGWIEVRCNGDHHQFKNPRTGQTVTVPGKCRSQVLSPNVVKSLERATGLSLRR